MKKTNLLIITILILSSSVFSSCVLFKENILVDDGIENFSVGTSSISLNQCILPSEEFINEFESINIDYHYKAIFETMLSPDGIERSIVYATYEKDVYLQAKQHCLNEMELSNENIIEYNGYTFMHNTAIDFLTKFPHAFNMFVYNDDLNTLVFLGCYFKDYTTDNAEEITNNWGEFLKEQFGEWYSFENQAVI